MNLIRVSLGLGYAMRISSIDLFKTAGTRNVPDCAMSRRFIAYGSPSRTKSPEPESRYFRKLVACRRPPSLTFLLYTGLQAQITASLVELWRAKNAAT